MKPERKITKILLKFGSLPSTKGFRYLKDGILYSLRNRESVESLKGLYGKIAEQHGTTAGAVERAARNSIRTGWNRRDRQLTEEIFGNSLQSAQDVPTSILFIAAIAEYLGDDD